MEEYIPKTTHMQKGFQHTARFSKNVPYRQLKEGLMQQHQNQIYGLQFPT